MDYLIDLYTVTGVFKSHNIPNIENYASLVDNSKLLDYANRLKIINDSPESIYYASRDSIHYNHLMKLHLSKTAPYYDPHKAVEAGRSALEISPTEYKCSFAIDLCKIYNNKDLPVYNPTQCIKTLAQYNQASKALPKDISYYFCASGQILILSEMFKTGNGVPVNPEKAALLEKYSKEFEETAKRLYDKEIAAIDAKHRAELERLRQQEADDFLSILGAVVGAVAPVIASGGNYVPPPSSYSSGSSGNASDNVNAALNAVITGMGGTSSSGGRTGTPGGGIDTGTPYDNSRYSGNNTNANNPSQRSGQNTGSKDDDDRAYWQSRRSPAADVNCIQRVKTSSGTHYKNVCDKRISVRGFCYPPKQVQKDYPGKGLYSPNDHSGLDHYNPGDVDAGAGLVSLENMCIKSGRRYMMLVCDASTKETHYSDGYPDSPDLRTYSCFK